MAKGKVEVQIGITGEAQYNQSLKNINASQKALRTEMKSLEQTFNGQANIVQALQSKYDNLQKQYDLQEAKVAKYAASLEKARANEEKANAKVVETKKAYDEAAQKLEEMKSSTDASADAIKEQEKVVEELNNELRSNVSALDNAATATANAESRYNAANTELTAMDAELQRTGQYLDEASSSTDGVAQSIDEFGNEVQDADKDTSIFSETLKSNLVGQAIAGAIKAVGMLVDGIKDMATACIETGSEFEASMSKVAAVSGAASEDLENLRQKAEEMGRTTMFSASEAAEAMNYMAMAGWKTEDMLSGIDGVMSLAAASGEDLATTSDIITDALTAFGLTAQDSAHFADVLAAASSNANTNVAMMGETFSYAAPIAGALGFSVEDTAEAIGLMANSGIKASSAGTALRRIMTELSGDVKIHSQAMGDVVIKTTEADGSMRGLSEILADCRTAFNGLSESEKAAAASSIVGKNAMSGFLALMNAAPADVDKLSTALKNCDGTAQAMADTMQNNLQGKLTILESALDGLKISLYDTFDESLKEGVDGATDAISRLNDAVVNGDLGVSLQHLGESAERLISEVVDDLIEALPGIIDGMAALVENADLIGTALTSLIGAWGTYKVASEAATLATQLLNAELSVNPIFAATAAIVALSNAVLGYYKSVIAENEAALKAHKSVNQVAKDAREAADASRDAAGAFKQSYTEIETTGIVANKLTDELVRLNSVWDESKSGSDGFVGAVSRQKEIIDQLNEAYPGLNLAINEQTGELNQNTEQIYANIAAMQARAQAAAIEERMTEIAKERLDIQREQVKVDAEVEEATQRLNEAKINEAYWQQQATDEAEAYNYTTRDTTAAVNEAADAHAEASHQLLDTKAAGVELEDQLAALDEETEYYNGILAANSAALSENASAATAAAGGVGQLKMSEDELADFTEAVNQSIDSQISLFDKFAEGTTVSASEMKSNLESQIEGLTEWQGNFDALADQIGGKGDALLKQLAEMGPQGNGYIKALLSMDDLSSYVEQYNEALQLKEDATAEIINSYLDAGVSVGEGFTEGIVQGHEDTASDVSDAAEKVVEDTKQAATEKAEEFTDVGDQAMTSTSEGVTNNTDKVVTAVKGAGAKAYTAAEESMGKDKFVTVGENITAGIAQGIESGSSAIVTQIQNVAKKAVETANASLKIESPSKVFRQVGEYIDLGLAEGIETKSDRVMDAINKTMEETVIAGASAVTTPSGMDTNTIAGVIANAIEQGLGNFALNVNADVDRDAIVKITVDANNDYKTRKGASQYV